MNRFWLLVIALLSFLATGINIFFALTDSKNAIGLSIVACLEALLGILWLYRFMKVSKTKRSK